ncbi:imprinted and ancient [Calocera cornea HHB12733]|uniref:Imprinted and ancient n=1 Tax=Calocera cornea HHB12733 TaxID=1353952 RepID=A0A165K9I4_9BASI|nr:imprinted and ancient [Calocera cornea HHB12733]
MESTGDDGQDYAVELQGFIAEVSVSEPERADVIAELEALQSIYGDAAIRVWKGNGNGPLRAWSPGGPIRYEVVSSLSPPHEATTVRILVTLPASYPSTSPPQLQLLSKYIGAFPVTSSLFGDVLRTYLSSAHGVEFRPGEVAVFDGLESVKERVGAWFGEERDRELAMELAREHGREREHPPGSGSSTPKPKEAIVVSVPRELDVQAELPEGIELIVAEPLVDRKSVFVGRACRITHPSQVPPVIAYLMSDRRISRAAHPVIHAWRCQVGNVLHQDNDDDGESAAGGRIAHLLQILDVNNVLVIVTRYFGGILLGADRFKLINQAARDALELGGFLDTDDHPTAKSRKGKK